MPFLSGEPTTKVTLRLFTTDLAYLKRTEDNYQVLIREIIKSWVKTKKQLTSTHASQEE